jgi:hypothetical protein
MKTLAKTLAAVIAVSAFATPAHAEVSSSGTKKIVKIKSYKAKKVKFLTTSANLETTTATPAPTPAPTTPATPPTLDPNTVMMAKLMELVKALVDSNSAALAALKQPTNSLVTTVSPVITVNPTVSSVNQQVQATAPAPMTLSNGSTQPSISLGHYEDHDDHR